MAESLTSRAAAGGRWTAVSAVAVVAIQMSQLFILGRLLDPGDFGLMAMMMVVIGLANTIADFGIANFIVRAKVMTGSLCSSLITVSLVCAVILALGIGLASPLVAAYFKRPALTGMLPVLGLVIALTATSQVGTALLQREMRFRAIAIAEILSGIAGLVLGTLCALAGLGVWALIVGQLANMGLKGIFIWGSARNLITFQWPAMDPELKSALRFGLFQTGERVASFTGQNVDKILVGRMIGETGLGMYSVAYQLVLKPVALLNPIFTRVALPLFSKIQDDDPRLVKGYLQVARTIGLFACPIYLIFIAGSNLIVKVLLGPQWANIGPLLQILSVIGILYSQSNPLGLLFIAKNRADLAFYYNLASIALYALAVFLGGHYGTTGVAIGVAIVAVGLQFPAEFYFRWALVGMTIMDYLQAVAFLALAMALPLVVTFGFRILYPHLSGLGWDFAGLLVALLIYAGTIWATERDLVRGTIVLLYSR